MFRLPHSEQELLKTSRLRFIEGAPLPASLLSDSVARSWERSRQAGVVPWQAPRFEPPAGLRGAVATRDDQRLYKSVHGEMEPLWSAFGGPNWALFCVNAQGVVIDARQSVVVDDPMLRPLTVGRELSETAIGTTAPSCALSDGVETIIDGNQHFLAQFESLFCLSVPLRGLDGQIVGALDITGRGDRDVDMLRHHFRYASLSTELRMIESLGQCHLLRLQADPRLMAMPVAGMIAVDTDGYLRAASLMARRILGLPAGGSVRAVTLDTLFPQASPVQRRRFLVRSATPQRILLDDGSHLWVQHSRAPLRGAHPITDESSADARGAVPDDWREQGLRAMPDAIHAFDGNVAAAARHLRISRSTLYARMKEMRRTGLL